MQIQPRVGYIYKMLSVKRIMVSISEPEKPRNILEAASSASERALMVFELVSLPLSPFYVSQGHGC